jgi:hypothetical protein
MSYSFRLPEEDPICECFYDEARDRMDRDDCQFHCDWIDDAGPEEISVIECKPPRLVNGDLGVQDALSLEELSDSTHESRR